MLGRKSDNLFHLKSASLQFNIQLVKNVSSKPHPKMDLSINDNIHFIYFNISVCQICSNNAT